jgi:hypothetical protein
LTNETSRIRTEIVRVQSLGPEQAKSNLDQIIGAIDHQLEKLIDFEKSLPIGLKFSLKTQNNSPLSQSCEMVVFQKNLLNLG